MMHNAIQQLAEASAKLNISKPTTPEEQKRRLEICVACEHYRKNLTCALCGCYMPYKTGWETIAGRRINCPDGRWTL